MNGAARFWKWSAAYPNVRLAALGFALIFVGGCVGKSVEGLGTLLINWVTEPTPDPNREFYLKAYTIGALVVTTIMSLFVVAGTVLLPFAAYRAIRDFLTTKPDS